MKNLVVLLVLFIQLFSSCNEKSEQKKASAEMQIVSTQQVTTFPELPKELLFFGEKINLEDEDLRERLDREILAIAYFQSYTTLSFKRAKRYFPSIESILKQENIPDDFKYLAIIESNLANVASPAGANGYWQFLPSTAKEYGLRLTDRIDERMNLKLSTLAACKYLKTAKDSLGDWLLAVAAYNRGIGGVRKDMKWQNTRHYFDTFMNAETSRYVFRLMAVKIIFENPEAYGYNLEQIERYEPYRTKSVKLEEDVENCANWSMKHGINYKILRKLNPWILGNQLSVKDGAVEILLPVDSENLKEYGKYK